MEIQGSAPNRSPPPRLPIRAPRQTKDQSPTSNVMPSTGASRQVKGQGSASYASLSTEALCLVRDRAPHNNARPASSAPGPSIPNAGQPSQQTRPAASANQQPPGPSIPKKEKPAQKRRFLVYISRYGFTITCVLHNVRVRPKGQIVRASRAKRLRTYAFEP